MAVAQFLLPGESVLYEAPEKVYYRRTPFTLYVTGGRLLLHAVTGGLNPGERAVAEPLAGVESVEYRERGFISGRGRLDIRFPGHVLKLTGRPATIKEVWRALQQHAYALGGVAADDEVTLVAPPPPLFDGQPYPPAQVEPLDAATLRPRGHARPALRRPVMVGLLVCLASAVFIFGLFRLRAARHASQESSAPETAPAATPQPTPTPTPVTLRLLDEVFTLEEDSHRAVEFGVPQALGPARVSGGFRVTWGSAVDFYLMSREQYERFASGGEPDATSAVYRQAQWNARVGARLPPGDYYLVFNNRDSEAGEQTVAAEFFMVYEQPAAP